MFCKQCGNMLADGALFCTKCGAPQNGMASAPIQNIEDDDDRTVGIYSSQQKRVAPVSSLSQAAAQHYQAPAQSAQQVIEEDMTVGPSFHRPPQQRPAQPAYQPPAQQKPVQTQPNYNPNMGAKSSNDVGFGEAIKLFFTNYANFSGRASKSEFWWAFLFNVIISLVSGLIPILGALVGLAMIVPGISLCVRRLHDIGKPGTYWFMGLIPVAGGIILLIQFLKDSVGDNQWGPGPAAIQGAGYVSNAPGNQNMYAKKPVTEQDFYQMAQNHQPVNVHTPDAKYMMDSALGKIIPTYTGAENLVGAIMLCDPQTVKGNIAAADTDTLLVIFKALDFYIGQSGDAELLNIVKQSVLEALKTRF